jgi:tetratricopeptide (TPR) repeat protein
LTCDTQETYEQIAACCTIQWEIAPELTLITPPASRRHVIGSLFVIGILTSLGCGESPSSAITPSSSSPDFVGSTSCQDCHVQEAEEWQGSHHEAAMQVADEKTVLGDFSDATFEYYSTQTRFLKIDGKYVVRTENSAGELEDFEITYTFGVEPLQQYLVDFPGGRKQALPFLWDTRPAESGGQRWFHLYPDEYIEPGDELHWTGANFNWNYSCAECHSTNLKMGYDASSNSFDTSWSEISVSCEACHGPGSEHILQANAQNFDDRFGLALSLDDRGDASWVMNVETGIAEQNIPHDTQQMQPEACGRCHSRRTVISPEYSYGQPLTETHMPTLLDDGLYFADGRIQDEVYVYGSFLQSKMYQAGVTCSDCHNPHSGELKTGPDSNDVCAQCHLPSVFANADHHGESSNSTQCVDCHMTSRTYMGNDDRRDHFFRIPTATSHRAETFTASGSLRVNSDLSQIAADSEMAGIVRATALSRLWPPHDSSELSVILAALDSPDALQRIGALRALRQVPPDARPLDGARLLADDIRSVRLEAAFTYVDISDVLELEQSRAFQTAASELRQTFEHSGSRAESQATMANFELSLGNADAAIALYEKALHINPDYLPAYLNYADLVGRAGDNERAIELLSEGIRRSPDTAALHHSIGLTKVRSGLPDDALRSLQKAAELEPDNSRYAYVFAIALNSQGQTQKALETLVNLRQQFPNDYDISWALATMLLDIGKLDAAGEVARQLKQDFPDDPNVNALIDILP